MNRPLFRRRELLYLALLLLAPLLFFCMEKTPAHTAVVEQNGIAIDTVSLTDTLTRDYNGLQLQFTPQGVWVVKANCPDQTCVKTGHLTKAGEAAVCLPNRVAVRLKGGAGYDGITY